MFEGAVLVGAHRRTNTRRSKGPPACTPSPPKDTTAESTYRARILDNVAMDREERLERIERERAVRERTRAAAAATEVRGDSGQEAGAEDRPASAEPGEAAPPVRPDRSVLAEAALARLARQASGTD